MTRRTLVSIGMLLLWSATWAAGPAPKPWTPAKGKAAPAADTSGARPARKPVNYIDGVPDTGQFLPDTATLGRVDDRVFSVWEFREYWFASHVEYRPKPDSAGRHEFLQSMVNKEVLAGLARRVNRPFTFEDRANLREHTQRVLSNVVFQRLVADSAVLTEAELRHAWEQGNVSLRFQHIATADQASAARARADLVQGRIAWPAAVMRWSVAKRDKGPDGDLGWVPRTSFDPAVALDVWDLKDGQISNVFLDAEGFQVLRVVERRPNRQPPFERSREIISFQLKPVKIQQRVGEVRGLLRGRVGMVYDSTDIAWAASMFGETGGIQRDEAGQPVLDMSGAVPEFAPADTARELCRWKEGRFTLGSFLSAYNAIQPLQRQNVGTFEALLWVLDGFVLEPYMAQLGVERGLDKDWLATSLIEKKREEIMVEHLFQDSVQAKVWIEPRERQEYYQARLQQFWTYQNVRFAAITRESKAGADSLVERLGRGEKAADILRADSLGGQVTGSIRTMREDEKGMYFKLLFEELRPGNVVVRGPDKQGVYLVMQKLEHDPGRQLSYDEVAGLIDESLQNIKAEALLKDLIARHRGEHTVVLHPERLPLVKLTDPRSDNE